MVKVLFSFFLIIASLINFSFAVNTQSSPIAVVQGMTDQIQTQVAANNLNMQNNPEAVYAIVLKALGPILEIDAMSEAAVGQNMWRGATSDQQTAFELAFVNYVATLYGSALKSYTGQTQVFKLDAQEPIQAQVSAKATQFHGESVAFIFNLTKEGALWRVVGFSVDNVSVIDSFKSQFTSMLRPGVDINRLTQALERHNAEMVNNKEFPMNLRVPSGNRIPAHVK